MKHPNREAWIPLLFGDVDPVTKQRLEAHLQSCAECRAEVEGWRRTVGRLNAWKLPIPRVARTMPRQMLAWAAAAAITAGAFLAGRLSAPVIDAQALRADWKSELSTELRRNFAHASSESANGLANLEMRLTAAESRDHKNLANEFVEVINAIRSEDRRANLALFEKLQQQYASDFMLLRKDLETVASFSDDEIRNARNKLTEIAANQTSIQQ